MNPMRGSDDQRLDALFPGVSRRLARTPEPARISCPKLWQRIESRQSFAFSLPPYGQRVRTAAVALSLVLGIYMAIPGRTNQGVSNESYIEALAEASTPDPQEFVNPVTLELADRSTR